MTSLQVGGNGWGLEFYILLACGCGASWECCAWSWSFFFKPLPDLSQPWTIFLRVGASGDKNCDSSKTGSCWYCQWSIGVGAGNFLGMRRIFCPDFPKFAGNTFLYKLSPKIFGSCWYITFSSTMLPYILHFSDGRLIQPWWKYKKIYKLIKLNILQARS